MRRKSFFILTVCAAAFFVSCNTNEELVINSSENEITERAVGTKFIHFNDNRNTSSTTLCYDDMKYFFGKINWRHAPDGDGYDCAKNVNLYRRVAEDSYLKVKYPQGKRGGFVFKSELATSSHAKLSYKFRLRDGFEFRRGGKLPGLAGGVAPTGGQTGYNKAVAGQGFTVRYNWQHNGGIVAYVYHEGMESPNHGTNFKAKLNGEDYILPIGEWINITQEVYMNTSEVVNGELRAKPNGYLKVWINGKLVIEQYGIKWMSKGNPNPNNTNDGKSYSPNQQSGLYPKIDAFMFSTFFGGSATPQNLPTNDKCMTDFDNFKYEVIRN